MTGGRKASNKIGGAIDDALDKFVRRHRHARGGEFIGPVPAYRRTSEQLMNHGGTGFASREFQDPYLRDLASGSGKPPERWLAELDPESSLGRLARRELGEDSFILLRTNSVAEWDDAYRGACGEFLTKFPPYDSGIAYPGHRYVTGDHVDFSASSLRVAPMNAPVRKWDPQHRVFLDRQFYPEWGVGSGRANQMVGLICISRAEGRLLPLDAAPRELFEEFNWKESTELIPNYLDNDLKQTRLQQLLSFTHGYAPLYRSRLVTGAADEAKGMREAVLRTSVSARYQLAARLGDPTIIDMEVTALGALAQRLRRDPTTLKQPRGIDEDVFTSASTDQLLGMALREPNAPRVFYSTYEWEHHRSQRLTKQLVRLFDAMKLGPVAASDIRRLTGLCEPGNLHFVSPLEHAMLDYYAAFVMGRKATNSARFDRLGNSLISNENAYHPDVDRAFNALIPYQPAEATALIEVLMSPEVQRSARVLTGGSVRSWNEIVDQANSFSDFLGLSGPRLNVLQPGS